MTVSEFTDQTNAAFERWWYEEGSGMPPARDEDAYEHVHRIARIAWENGAFCAIQPTPLTPKQP